MTDLLTSDETFPSVFDSLTTDERRELHKVLSSACNKFSTVTLCLGNITLKTCGSLSRDGQDAWQIREIFKSAGNEVFDIAMSLIP